MAQCNVIVTPTAAGPTVSGADFAVIIKFGVTLRYGLRFVSAQNGRNLEIKDLTNFVFKKILASYFVHFDVCYHYKTYFY